MNEKQSLDIDEANKTIANFMGDRGYTPGVGSKEITTINLVDQNHWSVKKYSKSLDLIKSVWEKIPKDRCPTITLENSNNTYYCSIGLKNPDYLVICDRPSYEEASTVTTAQIIKALGDSYEV